MTMHTPVHPGEILREDVLAELRLSVSEAARRLGVSRVTLSRVLHGHAALTAPLAVRLERAGLGQADFWMRLQAAHDVALARAADTTPVEPIEHAPASLPDAFVAYQGTFEAHEDGLSEPVGHESL